jgi:transcriptional regulator with XRE-family HTH domain
MTTPPERALACTTFGERFRRLRVAMGSKQMAMTSGVRCTDAAISHWELGKRLPSRRMIAGVLHTFLELGATPLDVDDLRALWQIERQSRTEGARRRRETLQKAPGSP